MSGGLDTALLALLVIASITDLIWGRIYNVLTFFFLATGLITRFWLGGWEGEAQACLAVALAFALFFPLWRLRAMAAGDVKLLMAAGAWTDPSGILRLAAVAIVIGALVGGFLLVKSRGLVGGIVSLKSHLGTAQPKVSHRIPFAPAFLCALLFLRIAELYHWTFL